MTFEFGVFSSQESELGEEQLQQIVSESKAENTKKCTSWGLTNL